MIGINRCQHWSNHGIMIGEVDQMLKKAISNIFGFIKKIYFMLFDFMIGNVEKKYLRFFTHVFAVMWFVILFGFVNHIIYSLTEGATVAELISLIARNFWAIMVLPCFIKLMIFIFSRIPDWP